MLCTKIDKAFYRCTVCFQNEPHVKKYLPKNPEFNAIAYNPVYGKYIEELNELTKKANHIVNTSEDYFDVNEYFELYKKITGEDFVDEVERISNVQVNVQIVKYFNALYRQIDLNPAIFICIDCMKELTKLIEEKEEGI